MEKHLDLDIGIDGNNIVINVCEPESGETSCFEFPFSPNEHPEFDQAIGREVYSWISLWMEEKN
jgi:hypothetical protein